MAPIALKDKRIEELTKQLVKRFITGELSKKNVPVAAQFALSNFRYHKYLDADSNKIERTVEGLCEKFSIHGQEHKSKSLSTLVEKFMSCPLFDKQYGEKSDAHYSLLKFLTVISDSPVNAVYHQPQTDQTQDVKDNFNWTKYLLEGEEKYTVHYYDTHEEEFWSDLDEDDESDSESDQNLEEGKELHTDEVNQLQDIKGTIRHPESNGVTMLEVRGILRGNLMEPYWLTNENSSVAEETSEISLASQWSRYCEETNPLGIVAAQILHEIQIVRETIWMLSGVKQLYVYNFANDKFTVRDGIEMTHITKLSLQKFLTTFADTATSIVELRSFIKKVCQGSNDKRIPQTFQAFGFSILKYLQKFNEDLSKIEESVIKKEETITLSVLQHRITQYQKEIAAIFNVYHCGIECIEKKENYEKVACFLNAFRHNILLADGLGTYGQWKVKVLLPLFLTTLGPYVEFLDGCLTEGKLIDDSDEFCIQRLSSIVNEGPELWRSVLKIKGDASEDNVSCPIFLQPVLQEIILAGKSIILLETLGELSKNADRLLQEESLNVMFTQSVSKLTDTQNMAELFPLCLYPHIQVKYEKSCSSLIHLLKTEYMLLDHLAALRDFFFLGAGDAMHNFYTDIFKKCARHERWQDMSYLNSLFQESLIPGHSEMQERFTVGYNKPTKITIDSFEGLELNYKALWPINLVIDASSQKRYNDVFLFLLHLKRAKWSLDDLRFKGFIDGISNVWLPAQVASAQ